MPLVWHLTNRLRAQLSPAALRALSQGWETQGHAYPDDMIEELARVLHSDEMHYESVLGYLETQMDRQGNRDRRQLYDGLRSWFVERISAQLYERHVIGEA